MKNLFKHLIFLNELKKFSKEKAAHYATKFPAQGEPLKVMDDIVFKAMLTSGTQDSYEALRSLLSACTHREVSGVKILNSEILPMHLEAKTPRLDVNVTFNDGEAANLEMQFCMTVDNLKARSSQYASMLQAGMSVRGKNYKEIKRVYQIFFLNFELFPESSIIPRRYGYREKTENDLLNDQTEIIFYELPKMEKLVKDYFEGKTQTDSLSYEEKWCIYIKYRHEKQVELLINELCQKEEGIMRAEKEVVKVDRSFLRYIRKMGEMKDKIDRFYVEKAAHEKGHTEGHAEGHAEGEAKISSEVLDLIAKGFSTEEIKVHLEKKIIK